jgi:hypothetical protein
MKILKKVITITILSAIFIIVGRTKSVFATEVLETNVIDLNNIESSSNVTVSDVLTYNEMANIMAKDQNISLVDAKKILGNDATAKVNSETSSSLATPLSTGYRTVAVEFSVGWPAYHPKLTFYIKTEEGGPLGWGIVSVLNTMLMTTDSNGYYRSFNGTTYTNLESITSIYYMINGSFYREGYTTYESGFEIGIGESCTIGYKSSSTNEFFASISEYGRFTQYP